MEGILIYENSGRITYCVRRCTWYEGFEGRDGHGAGCAQCPRTTRLDGGFALRMNVSKEGDPLSLRSPFQRKFSKRGMTFCGLALQDFHHQEWKEAYTDIRARRSATAYFIRAMNASMQNPPG